MEPIFVGDLVPSVATYKRVMEKYARGLKKGDFYEEPICEDFNYPDW